MLATDGDLTALTELTDGELRDLVTLREGAEVWDDGTTLTSTRGAEP